MTTILCGVDGSDHARLALRAAVRLSAQLDARLVVAHVVQATPAPSRLGGVGAPPVLAGSLQAELAAGRLLLEHVVGDEGLDDVEQRVVYGFPADRLADLADDEGAELIVVGSRGRGAFKAAFLGSVSSELIGVARRPVLVVPPGATHGRGPGPPGARGRGELATRTASSPCRARRATTRRCRSVRSA